MDLTGYVMELETLINRYLVLVFVRTIPIIFLLLLTWSLPYLDKKSKRKSNKRKTKRKTKLEKEEKYKTLNWSDSCFCFVRCPWGGFYQG